MSARTFVDTNVLLYADDDAAPAKQRLAEDLIEQLRESQSGYLSMQVLQEYYATAIRKLNVPAKFARLKVETYLRWNVITLQPSIS